MTFFIAPRALSSRSEVFHGPAPHFLSAGQTDSPRAVREEFRLSSPPCGTVWSGTRVTK